MDIEGTPGALTPLCGHTGTRVHRYDNDLRIPFVIRGPGIAHASTFDYIASQVDTIPTIFGLAGVAVPVSVTPPLRAAW